jgi:hypothetical protein
MRNSAPSWDDTTDVVVVEAGAVSGLNDDA